MKMMKESSPADESSCQMSEIQESWSVIQQEKSTGVMDNPQEIKATESSIDSNLMKFTISEEHSDLLKFSNSSEKIHKVSDLMKFSSATAVDSEDKVS